MRKAVGKDHLRVIDFIGNYANNFLIPLALFGDSSLNKDVIRKRLLEAQQAGTIAGVSSINFQELARERIFASLSRVKLDSMSNLKRALLELEQRLGRTPGLLDFARFDTVDPVVMATSRKCYWNLLVTFGRIDAAPTPAAGNLLAFLSSELVNGKRPHELLILQELLKAPVHTLSHAEIERILTQAACHSDEKTIDSALRVLSFEFATEPEKDRFGRRPLIHQAAGKVALDSGFRQLYETHPLFREHVKDAIENGLYLARHRYAWKPTMKVGERYSRKDACRLLNWHSNQQSVMYGYKVDIATNTCPIFITYHKEDSISESTAYEDEFLDDRTLRWFTRSKRTLNSDEVREILRAKNAPALHVFVKKDDSESSDFYYLGEATPGDAQQTTMPAANNVSVVTMKLSLASPVETALLDYLTKSTAPAMPSATP